MQFYYVGNLVIPPQFLGIQRNFSKQQLITLSSQSGEELMVFAKYEEAKKYSLAFLKKDHDQTLKLKYDSNQSSPKTVAYEKVCPLYVIELSDNLKPSMSYFLGKEDKENIHHLPLITPLRYYLISSDLITSDNLIRVDMVSRVNTIKSIDLNKTFLTCSIS